MTRRRKRFILALLAAIAVLVAVADAERAQAVLLTSDWQTVGDGLLTEDTDTGLKWLDLTETAGQSFDSVFAQLGAGGTYDGFRYATAAEVETFWTNAGIPTISILGDFQAANFTPISQLMAQMGGPLDSTVLAFSDGLTASTKVETDFFGNPINYRVTGRLQLCDDQDTFTISCLGTGLAVAALWDNNFPDAFGQASTGSYLVMETGTGEEPVAIPAPPAAALFGGGLGLLSLVGGRRARRAPVSA